MSTPFHVNSPPLRADLHEDLLDGIPPGWKDGQPQRLDPGRLVKHFRRLPILYNQIGFLLPNGRRVDPGGVHLLYMALAEIGWTIGRKAAIDALMLALRFKPPKAPPLPR